MSEVKIQESNITLKNGNKGKIAVFLYAGADDPVAPLDSAVSEYVGHTGYNEFIDANMDNPWMRVVVSDINQMKQEDFNPSRHKLQAW